MRKIVLFLISFLLLFLMGCSNNERLMGTGTIQGREILVTTKIPAEVKEVFVEEGKKVIKGDQLILLDDTEYKLMLQQAVAGLELVQTQLDEVLNGARYEEINKAKALVEKFEANLAVLNAQLDNLNKKIEHQQELFKLGAIPKQKLDDLITEQKVLENKITATKKDKEVAYWQLSILEKGQRSEVIDRLKAQVRNNKASVDLAKYKLNQTIITSPINGVVNSLNINKGENVTIGSTVTSIIDPQDLWIRVYLAEDVIGQVSVGQKVDIKIDSFPEKFLGKVIDIADKAQFTPRNVQTKDQRATMVFSVKIKILNGFDKLKIGLPADIYFNQQEKGEK